MLRINLLPPYIYEGKKKMVWLWGAVGIAAASLVGLLLWNGAVQSQLAAANARKTTAEDWKAKYDATETAITAEHTAVAKTKEKMTFVDNSKIYNDSWHETYNQMRDVTDPKVLLESMNVGPDRKTVAMSGFCQYETDLVRWWMNLRNTALFNSVHITLPTHGFDPNEPLATTGGNAGGAGFGGSGAGPGSFGSSAPRSSGGGGGGKNLAGAFAQAGGGGGGFGGGGGSSASGATTEEIEGRTGIKFDATAVLKNALAKGNATPVWPAGGGASTAAGGFGAGSFGGGGASSFGGGGASSFGGGGGASSSGGSSGGGKVSAGTKD